MRGGRVLLWLGLLLSCLCTVESIFEDQLGVWDWQQQYVGKVHAAAFSSRRCFVASEENVLAEVDMRSGGLAWRQVLDRQDHINAIASQVRVWGNGAKPALVDRLPPLIPHSPSLPSPLLPPSSAG